MHEALGRRKVVKSGRRSIVHGKYLLTTPEIRKALEELEKSKKQKAPQGKKGKKKAKAHNAVLSEESGSDWDKQLSEEMEVLDCIEVKV